MDAIRKLAGVLDAGAFVATFDDDTLVMFARQLVQWALFGIRRPVFDSCCAFSDIL